jgi:hypothetical protein
MLQQVRCFAALVVHSTASSSSTCRRLSAVTGCFWPGELSRFGGRRARRRIGRGPPRRDALADGVDAVEIVDQLLTAVPPSRVPLPRTRLSERASSRASPAAASTSANSSAVTIPRTSKFLASSGQRGRGSNPATPTEKYQIRKGLGGDSEPLSTLAKSEEGQSGSQRERRKTGMMGAVHAYL